MLDLQKLSRHKYLLIFVTVLIAGGALLPSRFAFTTTVSLKHRFFFLKNVSGDVPVRKNSYVMFPMHTQFILEGREFVAIKQVSCQPGDTLELKGRDYYCNGEFIASAKPLSMKGEPLSAFRFSGPVPSGMLFVTGHHKDSYDSRYFGFVRKEDVKAIVYPII